MKLMKCECSLCRGTSTGPVEIPPPKHAKTLRRRYEELGLMGTDTQHNALDFIEWLLLALNDPELNGRQGNTVGPVVEGSIDSNQQADDLSVVPNRTA